MQNVATAINCDNNCTCSQCCDVLPQTYEDFYLQSDLVQESSKEGNPDQTSGLVNFDDHLAGEAIDLPSHIETENSAPGINVELAKYLSRPVNIYSYVWAQGGTTSVNFDPWYEYLSHTSVKKRIDNYYLFRGNLKLKFVVNATPFYYGCMLVSYNPLKAFKAPFIGATGEIKVPLSQLPRVYLYPSVSQGGCMTLPFVYHREWLDITSTTDVRNMGNIVLTVLDSLKTASTGVSGAIDIQVYAWLENVDLSGPTVGLALQSGKSDEYGKSLISTTATAISRSLGELSKVPIIAPFATASSMIAATTATIAKSFGYTNVPVISDVHSVRPTPFPHMASTDIGTSIEKITLDSKNELSIDPKVAGADFGDELEISNIVTRESYLTTIPWTTSRATGDLLFNIAVTPKLMQTTAGTSQTIVNGTPTWLVSKMFTNWRGDMEYRFKVICSQYHRGRLRFSWDPNGAISTTIDSTTEVYTKIVDIAESTDIVIRVPFMKDTAYLYTGDDIEERFNTTAITQIPFYENGVLTVRVLNKLSAPDTGSAINILLFTRGTDNLEFARPKDIDYTNQLSPFTVQSGLLAYDNGDEDISSIALKPSSPSPHINLIYMGETVKSLRTIIRRPCHVRTIVQESSTAGQLINISRSRFNRFPMSYGYDPNGIESATGIISGTAKAFNFAPLNPLVWIGQCFLGSRGSIMWYVNNLAPVPIRQSHLARTPIIATLTATSYKYSTTGSIFPNVARSIIAKSSGSLTQGSTMTNGLTNTSNAASIPYYSIFKFRQCYPGDAILGSGEDDSDVDNVEYNTITTPIADNTANTNAQYANQATLLAAAGTDFSFLFYLAVPTLFYYASAPTASAI